MDTAGVTKNTTTEEELTHTFKTQLFVKNNNNNNNNIYKKYICLAKSCWKFVGKIQNE